LSEGVAYQNKDILLKILSKNYKDKTFSAYGLDLPPIKQLLPTNLPVLQLGRVSPLLQRLLTVLFVPYFSKISRK
jgi:hypothetical protein